LPYPIGHSLLAWSIGTLIRRRAILFSEWATALWWALLAISPDFDFLASWLTRNFSLHRTATHSLFTALVVGMLIAIIEFRSIKWRWGLFYAVLIASHGILDWATTGSKGSGPELFWPISNERYGLGVWAMPEFTLPGAPPKLQPILDLLQICFVEILVFMPVFLLITLALTYLRSRHPV
jgi:membrane-bound metal-dependent hydrolase YbcI (DUF457 family)